MKHFSIMMQHLGGLVCFAFFLFWLMALLFPTHTIDIIHALQGR